MARHLSMLIAGALGAVAVAGGAAGADASDPAWLGISFGPGPSYGAQIIEVHDEAPAALAGLRVGDAIMQIDRDPVVSASDLPPLIARRAVGDTVNLLVMRAGTLLAIDAVLAPKVTTQELLVRKLVGKPAPPVALRAADQPDRVLPASVTGQVTVLAWFALRCDGCRAVLDDVVARRASWSRGPVRLLGATMATVDELAAWQRQGGTAMPVGLDAGRPGASGLAAYTVDDGRTGVSLAIIDGRGVVRYAGIIDAGTDPDAAVAALDDASLAIARLIARDGRP